MEFGTEDNPGKPIRNTRAIVRDKNNSLRLEMARDHLKIVQHSQFHTQGWRANGDISIIISKSNPENPSVDEIIANERYVSGYACNEFSLQVLWLNFSMIWPTIKMNVPQLMQKIFASNF